MVETESASPAARLERRKVEAQNNVIKRDPPSAGKQSPDQQNILPSLRGGRSPTTAKRARGKQSRIDRSDEIASPLATLRLAMTNQQGD